MPGDASAQPAATGHNGRERTILGSSVCNVWIGSRPASLSPVPEPPSENRTCQGASQSTQPKTQNPATHGTAPYPEETRCPAEKKKANWPHGQRENVSNRQNPDEPGK